MPLDTSRFETSRQSAWPWRAGLVVSDPKLNAEISAALMEVRATCVFQIHAAAPLPDVAALIERDRPELLFVELGQTNVPPRTWMSGVQSADGLPLVAAVHTSADPEQMIGALRAGATEFLSLPMNPEIFNAMDRIARRLDGNRAAAPVQGRILGIVSSKGGCGATTVACHLGLALSQTPGAKKVLLADLDYQAPAVHRICRLKAQRRAGETFESVRRLSSSNWAEFFIPFAPGLDVMAGPDPASTSAPEAWRVESLFRHLTRAYPLTLLDLGRHLNPCTWTFLQYVDELTIVAAPDVLALYQTRYILQTLTNRGFERARMRLILNYSDNTPRDFWIESVEQMFEMKLSGVFPADPATFAGMPEDRLVFPGETPFGRAVLKLVGRMEKDERDKTASSPNSRRAA
jgi:pilus assembly protein CpaE